MSTVKFSFRKEGGMLKDDALLGIGFEHSGEEKPGALSRIWSPP
jgi:hypothetical protein